MIIVQKEVIKKMSLIVKSVIQIVLNVKIFQLIAFLAI
jgi:hypothetical protein